MVIEGDDAKAVFAALPRGVRARLSMAVLEDPADIRHYVRGALEAVSELDVSDDGALTRSDAKRSDSVEAALKRFEGAYDATKDAAKAVDDTLDDLLSREERMHALLGALHAAGKRLDISAVDADEG